MKAAYLCIVVCASAHGGAAPHVLLDNCTRPFPSSDEVRSEVMRKDARVGVGSARLSYGLHPHHKRAHLWFERALPSAGTLKLWVKGDGSGTRMQLVARHFKAWFDQNGNRRESDHRDVWLKEITLDFDAWRELSIEVPEPPKGKKLAWRGIVFHAAHRNDPPMSGTVLLDDVRLLPLGEKPRATLQHGLVGGTVRSFASSVQLFLDIRNFTADAGTARVRVTMVDRNENEMLDKDFSLSLKAGQAKEFTLDLAPENLAAFLPPFRITGDILSAELPAVTGQIDHLVVMSNSLFLWEDFSDAMSDWASAGYSSPAGFDEDSSRHWRDWLMHEGPRANTMTQITAKIARIDLAREKTAGPDGKTPPSRYALRIDYVDNAGVYNMRTRIPRESGDPTSGDRFLPGNAFRTGIWVRGDGSGATLSALFLDYSNMADFWPGGWKRTYDGERIVCRLDFEGWRYFEVDLPGQGRGTNGRRGSTDNIDFPIELAGFRIQSWRHFRDKEKAATKERRGTVMIGPITAYTQTRQSGMLGVHIAYDDPEHHYDARNGAWVVVQNSSQAVARTVRANWTLLDRANEVAAKGSSEMELAAGANAEFRIDIPPHAAATERPAPLRLRVVAFDANDASVTSAHEIALAHPDAEMTLSDFEVERDYYAYRKGAEVGGRTSSVQAHGGARSLEIPWSYAEKDVRGKKRRLPTIVAIDPPVPGAATECSLWIHGDESGALVYLLIGDTRGVKHGSGDYQFDILLGRTLEGPLQNAVRVDWLGWREVRFLLPVVPPTWDVEMPVWDHVPTYPLGMHIAIDGTGASKESGTLYFDDIRVRTHLAPEDRIGLAFTHTGTANVLPPGGRMTLTVGNRDANSPRTVTLSAAMRDWRGRVAASLEEALTLETGQVRRIGVEPPASEGVYELIVTMHEGQSKIEELRRTILVADLAPYLGAAWKEALRHEWKLRAPLESTYTFVDEDWDWLEYHPGNLQTQTVRGRAASARQRGGDPWVLLGYSAFYAAGVGFDEFQANTFRRRLRDEGHAVDTFLAPARLEDWAFYMCEVMRGAGSDVSGWILWNNPEAGPIAIPPERFAKMLKSADKWRRVYCPSKPLLIGGMGSTTAIPYLEELNALGALEHLGGVNVRLDVGVRSPEDAEVSHYTRALASALRSSDNDPKQILITDLDWAVEKSAEGLDEFDQAAYLLRAALLLKPMGVFPEVAVANEDHERLGLGLTYRGTRTIPPNVISTKEVHLKAGWWALARLRRQLRTLEFTADVDVQDIIPRRTRCMLFRDGGGRYTAFVWRNDDAGYLSFEKTGLRVAHAEDAFGAPVPMDRDHYMVGAVPTLFRLEPATEPTAQALARLWVRDGDSFKWPQQVLAACGPDSISRGIYRVEGGRRTQLAGLSLDGERVRVPGVVFGPGGKDVLSLSGLKGADVVLRRRFLLDGKGQTADVFVNGRPAGTWDLTRSDPKLSSGFRESIFVVDKKMIGATGRVLIEIRHAGNANTVALWAFACTEREFPLSAVGAVHVDQPVSHPRHARNVTGGPLEIGEETFAQGLGLFAPSLREISLNGQFARFQAKVGVDAATEGRGSVVVEVHTDGKKVYSSPVLSGIDKAVDIDVDVTGGKRLRLIVTDGGDGNKLDAMDICNPVLLK